MDELHSNTERVNFKGETPSKGDACETPVVPEEREEGAATSAAVGTHRKELDPKRMKVVELRSELKARGLSTGVKTILAEKLQKSLDEEKQKESEASSLVFYQPPAAWSDDGSRPSPFHFLGTNYS